MSNDNIENRKGGETKMQKTMIMLTLSLHHGKEMEAEQMLQILIREDVFKNAEFISAEGRRRKHYHILIKKDDFDLVINRLKNQWPGMLRKDEITEIQAEWIRQEHSQPIMHDYAVYNKAGNFEPQ